MAEWAEHEVSGGKGQCFVNRDVTLYNGMS